ncbi:hypothetical protein CLV51_102515 [Chitinophaga niastensis]|uniref:Uncharacterized protein n=1 Tax=Chitinophaga niastensis TaxID=536980 RepID=A0A2P8HN59_CHINA|nr:hypothetical protein CLV51_102515 [Chitinophaga niastensis]
MKSFVPVHYAPGFFFVFLPIRLISMILLIISFEDKYEKVYFRKLIELAVGYILKRNKISIIMINHKNHVKEKTKKAEGLLIPRLLYTKQVGQFITIMRFV